MKDNFNNGTDPSIEDWVLDNDYLVKNLKPKHSKVCEQLVKRLCQQVLLLEKQSNLPLDKMGRVKEAEARIQFLRSIDLSNEGSELVPILNELNEYRHLPETKPLFAKWLKNTREKKRNRSMNVTNVKIRKDLLPKLKSISSLKNQNIAGQIEELIEKTDECGIRRMVYETELNKNLKILTARYNMLKKKIGNELKEKNDRLKRSNETLRRENARLKLLLETHCSRL